MSANAPSLLQTAMMTLRAPSPLLCIFFLYHIAHSNSARCSGQSNVEAKYLVLVAGDTIPPPTPGGIGCEISRTMAFKPTTDSACGRIAARCDGDGGASAVGGRGAGGNSPRANATGPFDCTLASDDSVTFAAAADAVDGAVVSRMRGGEAGSIATAGMLSNGPLGKPGCCEG